ncbi:MAG TPA: 30S ribosomal protein S16 [Myxococcota bacterium]|jgi:small subunit ribosomal protein S16|nr:30S ribosomal protein S16 [Myxococcota bacterium]
MMMLRLKRTGMRNVPYYRLVLTDHRSARDGKFLEVLGTYDPKQNPPLVQFKLERVDHWLAKGAKPSETVGQLLKRLRKAAAAAAAAAPATTPA